MTVRTNIDRTAVEITYDTDAVDGDTIDVKATNPETGDVSTRSGLANDGRFTWTVPAGYVGSADFTVTGSDGGDDTGTVRFG